MRKTQLPGKVESRTVNGRLAPWSDTPGAQWREEGLADPFGDRYDCARSDLVLGDRTDDYLANEVYLYDHRNGLNSLRYIGAARDRIRWLSRRLAVAEARVAELEEHAQDGRPITSCPTCFTVFDGQERALQPVAMLVREIGEDTWFDHSPVKPGTTEAEHVQGSPIIDYCTVYAPASPLPVLPAAAGDDNEEETHG